MSGELKITECYVVWLAYDDGTEEAAYLCESHPKILESGWVNCWPFAWLFPDAEGGNGRDYFDQPEQRLLPAWRVLEITCPS